MRRPTLARLGTTVLTALLLASVPALAKAGDAAADPQQQIAFPPLSRADRASYFARTELYFGSTKPGGVITDADFREFLDREITPRFPAGFTLLKGYGQFLNSDGVIVGGDSYVLVILYRVEALRQANTRIEAIRRLFKAEFQVDAVLRVDDSSVSRVSF